MNNLQDLAVIKNISSFDIDDILSSILLNVKNINLKGIMMAHAYYPEIRERTIKIILSKLGENIKIYCVYGINYQNGIGEKIRILYDKHYELRPNLFGYPIRVKRPKDKPAFPNFMNNSIFYLPELDKQIFKYLDITHLINLGLASKTNQKIIINNKKYIEYRNIYIYLKPKSTSHPKYLFYLLAACKLTNKYIIKYLCNKYNINYLDIFPIILYSNNMKIIKWYYNKYLLKIQISKIKWNLIQYYSGFNVETIQFIEPLIPNFSNDSEIYWNLHKIMENSNYGYLGIYS